MKKLIINTLVILICGFTFKADSQRQSNNSHNFIISVNVQGNAGIYNTIIEGYIRNELRKIDKVEITDEPKWLYLINIHTHRLRYESGEDAGRTIIFYSFLEYKYENVEKDERNRRYFNQKVRYPFISSSLICSDDKLEQMCVAIITEFDKAELQPAKDLIKSMVESLNEYNEKQSK